MAAPMFVTSVAYNGNFTASSINVAVPEAAQGGDLLIFVMIQQPARDNYPGLGHTPAGWTVLTTINQPSGAHAYWKVWQTGDPTSFTFSWFGGEVNGPGRLLVYRGADPDQAIAGSSYNAFAVTATPSSNSYNPADWTGANPARQVLVYGTAGARPRTLVAGPSGSTLQADTEYITSIGTMHVFDLPWEDKASSDSHTATFSQAQEGHTLSIMIAPSNSAPPVEGAGEANAAVSLEGALTPAVPGTASVGASVSIAADGLVSTTAVLEVSAVVEADALVAISSASTLEAVGAVTGQGAIATQAEGQPLVATATMSGSLALVMVASTDPLLVEADVEGDGLFAIPGAAHIIATFDFELLAGVIRFAEGDIYAFGVLENVLFAQVRRKAAGSLEPLFDATLAGFVRMAASGSATGTAEITRAMGGRERRDAPALLAQAMAMLAGRSGPGGHAVVFPSAVVIGALVQGTVAETDITAEGRIEDFAPGAVVIRIASASIFARATTEGIARRDTSSAGTVTASGTMIGDGGLLQRAASDHEASGTAELNGALIAVGGAGSLAALVVLVGDARRTIYDSRHLHVDVTMTGTGRRETFAVSGLEGAGVNVVATGGYEQRATTAITALGKLNEPIAGFVKAGAGSLAMSATATLSGAELGSAGALAVTVDMEGAAPLSRIAAGDLAAMAATVGAGGYQKTAEATVDASATVEPAGSVALGASASLSVFGLVLATVAPFQIGEGALMAQVRVAESGATRLLGSRIFIHAEAFVWPRGGFPVDGTATVSVGAAITASAV